MMMLCIPTFVAATSLATITNHTPYVTAKIIQIDISSIKGLTRASKNPNPNPAISDQVDSINIVILVSAEQYY
jgi:hypothetical protein